LQAANVVVKGNELFFDVTAKRYAHAVYFNLDDDVRLSDAYFDLLPGETRRISAVSDRPFAGDLKIQIYSYIPKKET